MSSIGARRREIYDHFHENTACQRYFYAAVHEEEYVAYYTSMYLLQDATEAMLQHRAHGFSSDPLVSYLEFWGIMQAAIIQQDSIAELHQVVVGSKFNHRAARLKYWREVRELRNRCAGHPARKDLPKSQPLTRTFMGRAFGSYDSLTYERWQQGVGTTHPRVQLGKLLDAYEVEAESELVRIIAAMKKRWP